MNLISSMNEMWCEYFKCKNQDICPYYFTHGKCKAGERCVYQCRTCEARGIHSNKGGYQICRISKIIEDNQFCTEKQIKNLYSYDFKLSDARKNEYAKTHLRCWKFSELPEDIKAEKAKLPLKRGDVRFWTFDYKEE